MARPSKRRQQALASQTVAAEQFTVVHKTAIYARLSREDNLNSSDSIENQLALLNEYVSNRPYLQLAGTFVDNGYTGTDRFFQETHRSENLRVQKSSRHGVT